MWNLSLREKAEAYAISRGIELIGPLGAGLEGSTWHVESKQNLVSWAVKMHRHAAPYRQERNCYHRLTGTTEVAGFQVPQLLRADDEWLAIEMTIVERPFVLDFAQTFLDFPPDFTDEVWEERIHTWSELYGDDWPMVRRLLHDLENFEIYYLDVHRQNIAPSD